MYRYFFDTIRGDDCPFFVRMMRDAPLVCDLWCHLLPEQEPGSFAHPLDKHSRADHQNQRPAFRHYFAFHYL